MKQTLAFLAALLLAPLAALHAEDKPAQKPNILIILADDIGYADVGVMGLKEVQTPHLDALASGGVRFTAGYTSGTMCSPTRAGLLTGRYQTRFGHEFNYHADQKEAGLPAEEKTIADRLQAAGYVTGMIGKWHVGEPQYAGFHPLDRGFTESVYYGGQQKVAPRQALRGRSETFQEQEFIGLGMAREAAQFMSRHRERPWFLYYAPNLVHTPHDVLPEHLARVDDGVTDEKRRRYLASVAALDDSVGKVLAAVRENGQEERTLVFFLGDNGGGAGSDNRPLKAGKGTTFEGGIRVPFFVKWTGVIPAGRELRQPVISLDLLPTALAVAGVAALPEWRLDGKSLLPMLKGESDTGPHPEGLFWRFGSQWAARVGDWKLLQGGSRRLSAPALYNLADDIGEAHNLIRQHPDKEGELRVAWNRWNEHNAPARWVLTEE